MSIYYIDMKWTSGSVDQQQRQKLLERIKSKSGSEGKAGHWNSREEGDWILPIERESIRGQMKADPSQLNSRNLRGRVTEIQFPSTYSTLLLRKDGVSQAFLSYMGKKAGPMASVNIWIGFTSCQ